MINQQRLLGAGLLLLIFSGTVLSAEMQTGTDSETPRPSPRIVGGISTNIAQVPATVALLRTSQIEIDGNLYHSQYCAGTLIATRWVLTAAHCVTSFFGNANVPGSIKVLTGSADLINPTNQPIGVKRIIRHPQYTDVEDGQDIALVELEYDAMVEPIAMDTQPVQINDLAFIAGWGALNDKGDGQQQEFPTTLKGAFVRMTPGSLCADLYPVYAGFTRDTVICAGVPAGGKDTCQGDSGGPLYRVDLTENRVVSVTGITSWGIGCGLPNHPGIYTSVASFYDWIQSILQTSDSTIPPANDGVTIAPRQPSKLPQATGSTTLQPAGDLSYNDLNSRGFLGAFLPGLLLLSLALMWRVYGRILAATESLPIPAFARCSDQSSLHPGNTADEN